MNWVNDWDDVINKATSGADGDLGVEIAKITSLRTTEIESLFPDMLDKLKFAELMHLVHSDETESTKLMKIASSTARLGGALLKLLAKI